MSSPQPDKTLPLPATSNRKVGLALIFLALALMFTTAFIIVAHAGSSHIGKNEHISIHKRHKMMENAAFAAKTGAAMMHGKARYDGTKAEAIMRLMRTTADNMLEHFSLESIPAKGSGSLASPKIWADWAGFKQQTERFRRAAAQAEAQAANGPAAFKAGLISVMQECKACHQKYKLRK